ncbi:MAG TPA: regulatory protein RecX [Rhodanobacteraceae bacterium]
MWQRARKRGAGDADKPRRSAYDKALGLLARREYSRHELQARLVADGQPAADIEQALQRLIDDGYQSDERYAAMLVRSRIRQGYGPQRLRMELKNAGVAAELADAALDQASAEHDWLALAREQLRKRYGDAAPADYAERAKRTQFLLRRGFAGDIARKAGLNDGE